MAKSMNDSRIMEQKDTISQLNMVISSQNELITSLRSTVEECNATISSLREQVEYLTRCPVQGRSDPVFRRTETLCGLQL